MAQQVAHRQLYRSRDACIAGVCAGIAKRCDCDALVVRILLVLLLPMTLGLAAIAYLILWVYLPVEPETGGLYDVTPEHAESTAFGNLDCSCESPFNLPGMAAAGPSLVARLAVGVAVVLLFLLVSFNVAPMVPGARWWQFWPLIALMAGLCLIIIPIASHRQTAWHAAGIVLLSASALLLPCSLGMFSWDTISFAVEQAWIVLVLAVAMFAWGFAHDSGVLMVSGAFCFTAFCIVALALYSVPGDLDALTLILPDGSSMLIAISLR